MASGLKNARKAKVMISLDEAIESAKLSAGRERILRSQHYDDLLAQLAEEDHYPFTIAITELGIGVRTGQRSKGIESFLERQGSFPKPVDFYDACAVEDRLVQASRHIDAGWWDDLKRKIKEWTGWGDDKTEDYLEDEYRMTEPAPGTDEEVPGPLVPTEEEVEDDLEELPDYERFEKFPLPEEDYEMPVMHAVESSNLEAIGYDEEGKLLYIAFKPKRNTPRTMYRYFDVEGDEFGNLLRAPSKGQWFHQNIRNVKEYEKLDIGLLAD